ncbi:MAG: ABC transporter ATP-binding protein [Clostridiales bacterium]|nr:ABC transporter ATP-binding protein [Clostridiales bacterium]
MACLKLCGIKKNFKKKQVLRDVSLEAERGCCVGILGANGCGKSTLLSVLAGVLAPDAGEFLWDGADLFSDRAKRRSVVGYVPQGLPLMEELTAWDNLKFWYRDDVKKLKQDLINGVPAMMGVDAFLRVPPKKMSGGMKKRLCISCAVSHGPQLLLLDEPSAALDLVCREQIDRYIKDFTGRGGVALLATHDAGEFRLCDEWHILKDGALCPYDYDGDDARLASLL